MNTFRQSLTQKSLLITATLPTTASSTAESIARDVGVLAPHVDAVQLFDDRAADGQLSAMAAATLVLQQGVDPVVHMTCRDRNRLALHADVLGCVALGVTSLMLSRGEKLKDSKTARGKGVFDIRSAALMQMANAIGENRDLVAEPGLLLGAPVTVFAPEADWQPTRIQNRIDAGATLLQSQPCLNVELLTSYLRALIERKFLQRASFVVDVPLLLSASALRELMLTNPGSAIPEAVAKTLLESSSPRDDGLSICAEMVRAATEIPGVAGINIHHNGDVADVVAVIQAAGIAER